MKHFKFDGVIPASKSHFNRALICASYGSLVKLTGDSQCDDVLKMKAALKLLGTENEYDCGSAGTVLRFLAFRVSRLPGRHILKGTTRLMSRPQDDFVEIFQQLGVRLELYSDHIAIEGNGWNLNNKILKVSRKKSSQFVSGLLLNSWDLETPLTIQWDDPGVSEGYWQMSVQTVKDFGMNPQITDHNIIIPPKSQIKIQNYHVESDVSSTFAIAAYAALNGEAIFRKFPYKTLQPDIVYIDILEKMGVGIIKGSDYLHVRKPDETSSKLKGVFWNLNNCPDLFPVLATLCAFAKSPSRLDGAPHLVFKESNRIQKTAELIQRMKVEFEILPDGMSLQPPQTLKPIHDTFEYDTDHDHRLAFAASLLASQKYPIQILHPEVVNKSFPEYWQLLNYNSE